MDILKNLIYSNIVRKVGEAFDKPAGYPEGEEKPPKETQPSESPAEKPRGRTASPSAEKPGN